MWLTTISSMGIHHTRDLHLLGKRAFSGYIPKQIRTVEMEISSWNKGMYIAQLVFDNDLRGDVFFPATTDWLNCFSTDACPIHNGYLSDSQRILIRFTTDAYPIHNGCLSDSQRMLIRLRSVNYQGMIFHYPFY